MIESNLKLLAQHDLGGAFTGGEGMALKVMPNGRRYLFIAPLRT